jgi:hypothetical protein
VIPRRPETVQKINQENEEGGKREKMALTKAIKQLLAVIGSKRRSKTTSPISPSQPAPPCKAPVPIPVSLSVREKEQLSRTKPVVPVSLNAPPKGVEEKQELSESSSSASVIESLPIELRIAILEVVTEVKTLDALLRASPACWRAFRGVKERVLKVLLERELAPSLLLEAKTVMKAKRVPRNEERLISLHRLMMEYKESKAQLASENASASQAEEPEDDEMSAVEMANRELLIQHLVLEFCRDALRPVSASKKSRWQGSISELENHRISRALYRFEIFVQLFAMRDLDKWFGGLRMSGEEIAELYFWDEGMKAWEVEELACIRDWMVRVYGGLLEETKELLWEMDVENERQELRCFMKEGEELECRAVKQVQKRREFSPFPVPYPPR